MYFPRRRRGKYRDTRFVMRSADRSHPSETGKQAFLYKPDTTDLQMKEFVDMLNRLTMAMIEYYSGDPRRIQHFLKVHELAKLIAENEGLDDKTRLIIEAAALVHDVGIKIAEKLYGECTGRHQEQLGPPMAKRMLAEAGFNADVTERVCWLVGHHHTYTDIDGVDLRILIEADFLVNLYENGDTADAVTAAYNSIFVTESGRLLCRMMFGINP